MSDLHHECGIAAIYHLPGGDSSPLCPEIAHGVQAREEVSRLMPRMLLDIQNRGQLSAGFTTFNPRRNQLIDTYKEIGSVSEVFRINHRGKHESLMKEYGGRAAIGHRTRPFGNGLAATATRFPNGAAFRPTSSPSSSRQTAPEIAPDSDWPPVSVDTGGQSLQHNEPRGPFVRAAREPAGAWGSPPRRHDGRPGEDAQRRAGSARGCELSQRSTTEMPIDRAEPATTLMAASMSSALRSGSLRSAIDFSWARVMVPPDLWPGVSEPDFRPSSLRIRKLVGGVLYRSS